MANRYVVATGGLESGIPVEKTHRFEMSTQTWQQLPDMNVARSHHASCSLDGNVYVFCGQDRNQEPLNSIEVLEDTASNLDLIEAWKLIRVADTILFPRSSPGVAPLNDNEIVVMGGFGGEPGDEEGPLGDVVIFDVEQRSCTKVVNNLVGLLQFTVEGNQTARVGTDSVVALVSAHPGSRA